MRVADRETNQRPGFGGAPDGSHPAAVDRWYVPASYFENSVDRGAHIAGQGQGHAAGKLGDCRADGLGGKGEIAPNLKHEAFDLISMLSGDGAYELSAEILNLLRYGGIGTAGRVTLEEGVKHGV